MRTSRAPAEPRRNPRAAQRVLDHRLVAIGIPQQDRNLVEGYTFARQSHDPAGDLDGLQSFAGGREELESPVILREPLRAPAKTDIA